MRLLNDILYNISISAPNDQKVRSEILDLRAKQHTVGGFDSKLLFAQSFHLNTIVNLSSEIF